MSLLKSGQSKHEDSWAAIAGVIFAAVGWQFVSSTMHDQGLYRLDSIYACGTLIFGGMLIGASLSKSAAKRQVKSASKKAK